MNKRITYGLFIASSLLILVVTIPGAYLWLPAKIRYHIVEKHKLSVIEDQTTVRIGIIIPKSGPYQEIENIRVQWNGEQELDSDTYTETYRLWVNPAAENEFEVVIEYDVILPQDWVSWRGPVENEKLLPQDGIESDHPDITQRASQLSNDPFKIYQFTSGHLIFSEENCEDTNISALEAYRATTGACAGFARLMVALCRAAGIPAQMIIGSTLPDNYFPITQITTTGIPGQGHAWVEYYSQGNWRLADPSWGKGFASRLQFNRNDGLHLSYGEHDRFFEVRDRLLHWANIQSFTLDEKLTYVIASSTDSTSAESEIQVVKKWDERWINTLLVLAFVTYLLVKFRDKVVQ